MRSAYLLFIVAISSVCEAQLSPDFSVEVLEERTQPPVLTRLGFSPSADGDSIQYNWDFGNGESSTEATPNTTYTIQGFVNVSLAIFDTETNETASLTKVVPVRGFPSVSIISPSLSFLAETEFVVNASGSDSLSQPLLFDEDFEIVVFYNTSSGNIPLDPIRDNTVFKYPSLPESSSLASSTFVFVQVKAIDRYVDGNRTIFRNVTATRRVPPTLVTLNFDTEPEGLDVIVNDEVFTTPTTISAWANSLIFVEAPPQDEFNFLRWSDGGAQSRSVRMPAGSTTRNFTAFFQVGGESLFTFNYTSTAGALPATVDFTTSVIVANKTFAWDFGDGNNSTDPNPTHNYTRKGIYNASLTVVDEKTQEELSQVQAIAIRGFPDLTILSPDPLSFVGGANFTVEVDASDSFGQPFPDEEIFIQVDYFDGETREELQPFDSSLPNSFRYPSRPRNSTAANFTRIFVSAGVQDEFAVLNRTREIIPLLALVELTTLPNSNLELIVFNGERVNAPITIQTWPNGDFPVIAPDQGDYTFQSWSNGRTQEHILDVPSFPSTTRVSAIFSNPVLDEWKEQRAKGSTDTKNTLTKLFSQYFSLDRDGDRRKLRVRG